MRPKGIPRVRHWKTSIGTPSKAFENAVRKPNISIKPIYASDKIGPKLKEVGKDLGDAIEKGHENYRRRKKLLNDARELAKAGNLLAAQKLFEKNRVDFIDKVLWDRMVAKSGWKKN